MGMPSFEWLKIKEGETKGNPKKNQGIPQSFLAHFIKKNAWYLHAGKCQEYFRMACALCEFGCCKTAKMRVGYYLGPLLQIFRVNLPWNFDILCMKGDSMAKLFSGQRISWIFFPAWYAILNYTGKYLVVWDLVQRSELQRHSLTTRQVAMLWPPVENNHTGLRELMWRRLEVSKIFLSRGEENAKLWVAENQRREIRRKYPKIPGNS